MNTDKKELMNQWVESLKDENLEVLTSTLRMLNKMEFQDWPNEKSWVQSTVYGGYWKEDPFEDLEKVTLKIISLEEKTKLYNLLIVNDTKNSSLSNAQAFYWRLDGLYGLWSSVCDNKVIPWNLKEKVIESEIFEHQNEYGLAVAWMLGGEGEKHRVVEVVKEDPVLRQKVLNLIGKGIKSRQDVGMYEDFKNLLNEQRWEWLIGSLELKWWLSSRDMKTPINSFERALLEDLVDVLRTMRPRIEKNAQIKTSWMGLIKNEVKKIKTSLKDQPNLIRIEPDFDRVQFECDNLMSQWIDEQWGAGLSQDWVGLLDKSSKVQFKM